MHRYYAVILPHAAFLCIVKTSLDIFFYIKEGSKSTSYNILDSIDLLLKKNTCM